jgi:hypothetical protein
MLRKLSRKRNRGEAGQKDLQDFPEDDPQIIKRIPSNDTLVALRRCLSEFPLILISRAVRSFSEENPTLERVGGCPLIVQTVLYAECADRLQVDRDLASLQNARIARRLKISSGQDDWAVVLTQDLNEYLNRKRREQPPLDPIRQDGDDKKKNDDDGGGGGNNNGDSSGGGGDPEANSAVNFYAYIANTLYSSTTLSDEDAERLYSQWCKSGSPFIELECDSWGKSEVVTRGSSATTSSYSSLAERVIKHVSAKKIPPLSTLIRWLLHTGLLIKRIDVRSRTAISQPVSHHPLLSSSSSSSTSITTTSITTTQAISASAYLFGAPECGRLVAYLREGRAELNRKLRKNASRELSLDTLQKSSLRKSSLPTRLHLLDAIGSGMAVVVETASGKFIRAAAH